MKITDTSEVEVSCLEGTVWRTTDCDPKDIILEAGTSFTSLAHR
jgi:Protein of unknown function (DUF2917)